MLDPEQNRTFKDNYLDIPFDLSEVLFITTANDASTIPAPLYDRMDVIELSSYTRHRKFNIAKKHLLPKQLKNNGLTGKVTMSAGALYQIIDGYTREAGVRNLERTITMCCASAPKRLPRARRSRSASRRYGQDAAGPGKGQAFLYFPCKRGGHRPTALPGPAWAARCCRWKWQVIPRAAARIELTGSLGDVMKESAHLAVTYARVHADE